MSSVIIVLIAVVVGLAIPMVFVASHLLGPNLALCVSKLVQKIPKPVVRVVVDVGEFVLGLVINIKPR